MAASSHSISRALAWLLVCVAVSGCDQGDNRQVGLCEAGGHQIEDLYARIEIYKSFRSKARITSGDTDGEYEDRPFVDDLSRLVYVKSLFDDESREYYEDQINVLTYEVLPDRLHRISVMIDADCVAEATWAAK